MAITGNETGIVLNFHHHAVVFFLSGEARDTLAYREYRSTEMSRNVDAVVNGAFAGEGVDAFAEAGTNPSALPLTQAYFCSKIVVRCTRSPFRKTFEIAESVWSPGRK